MGKHLTYEEKLNAENERNENRLIMKWLREQLNALKYRNERLTYYLKHRDKSKHNGLYGIDGTCNMMFGKRFRDLTAEEKREYNRVKQREYKNK